MAQRAPIGKAAADKLLEDDSGEEWLDEFVRSTEERRSDMLKQNPTPAESEHGTQAAGGQANGPRVPREGGGAPKPARNRQPAAKSTQPAAKKQSQAAKDAAFAEGTSDESDESEDLTIDSSEEEKSGNPRRFTAVIEIESSEEEHNGALRQTGSDEENGGDQHSGTGVRHGAKRGADVSGPPLSREHRDARQQRSQQANGRGEVDGGGTARQLEEELDQAGPASSSAAVEGASMSLPGDCRQHDARFGEERPSAGVNSAAALQKAFRETKADLDAFNAQQAENDRFKVGELVQKRRADRLAREAVEKAVEQAAREAAEKAAREAVEQAAREAARKAADKAAAKTELTAQIAAKEAETEAKREAKKAAAETARKAADKAAAKTELAAKIAAREAETEAKREAKKAAAAAAAAATAAKAEPVHTPAAAPAAADDDDPDEPPAKMTAEETAGCWRQHTEKERAAHEKVVAAEKAENETAQNKACVQEALTARPRAAKRDLVTNRTKGEVHEEAQVRHAIKVTQYDADIAAAPAASQGAELPAGGGPQPTVPQAEQDAAEGQADSRFEQFEVLVMKLNVTPAAATSHDDGQQLEMAAGVAHAVQAGDTVLISSGFCDGRGGRDNTILVTTMDGTTIGCLNSGFCDIAGPLLDNNSITVGRDPVVEKWTSKHKFITIVLTGPGLPAPQQMQRYHMEAEARSPLGYTMAIPADIDQRNYPQWQQHALRGVERAAKAAGDDAAAVATARGKALHYYQIAGGFLQMQTARNQRWMEVSYVPLKLALVAALLRNLRSNRPDIAPLEFTAGFGFTAGPDRVSMQAHLAVLDKAERYALQLAAAEAPVGWTERTPAPDGFFANMAAEHLGPQDNELDGAMLELNTLDAIKQAKEEQTLQMQAAEMQAAAMQAKLADLKLGVARLAASEKQETRRVRP